MLSVSSSHNYLADSWILDSAYSYHMMPNKDWFHSYMSVDSDSVLMDNDASCKVTEIENIKIKMFDGMISMLGNIRHVPNLRKNLISLGTLDGNENTCRSESGIM